MKGLSEHGVASSNVVVVLDLGLLLSVIGSRAFVMTLVVEKMSCGNHLIGGVVVIGGGVRQYTVGLLVEWLGFAGLLVNRRRSMKGLSEHGVASSNVVVVLDLGLLLSVIGSRAFVMTLVVEKMSCGGGGGALVAAAYPDGEDGVDLILVVAIVVVNKGYLPMQIVVADYV
ncbi:unnamed protein product [Ilex paraguariensis]|uniref:Uncharacterized protein n=1 Tax=Ilex paraguariensis TaxID=185542 RepID=A0ABC8RSH1_9AQUA